MARLADGGDFAALARSHRSLESDASVLAEWDAELAG
jgi:hypothetical protein